MARRNRDKLDTGSGISPASPEAGPALKSLGEIFAALMARGFTGQVFVPLNNGVPAAEVRIAETVNILLTDNSSLPREDDIRDGLARLHALFEQRRAWQVTGNTEIRFDRGRLCERARCEFFEEICR